MTVDPAVRIDQRVALAGRRAGGFEALGVALAVLEPERVLLDLGRRQNILFRSIEQLFESCRWTDPVVEIAARADAEILFPFLEEDHRSALGALVPQVFGTLALGQERDAAANSAKPTH